MKKFKKTIEISFENLAEVLKCPIVEGIRKENSNNYRQEGRGNCYTMDYVLLLDVYNFDLPFGLLFGDVLALDICGTWYAFTKKEWDKHKNDEI